MPHTLTRSGHSVRFFTALCTTLALFSIGTFNASAEQVYKWVDEKGVVTFGDKTQRPETVPVENVNIKTHQPATKTEAELNAAAKAEKDAKDGKEAAEAPKPVAEAPKMPAAEKRKLCAQARADLAAIQSRGQVREQDAKGNLTYLSDEQKQARIKAANKNIREFCR